MERGKESAFYEEQKRRFPKIFMEVKDMSETEQSVWMEDKGSVGDCDPWKEINNSSSEGTRSSGNSERADAAYCRSGSSAAPDSAEDNATADQSGATSTSGNTGTANQSGVQGNPGNRGMVNQSGIQEAGKSERYGMDGSGQDIQGNSSMSVQSGTQGASGNVVWSGQPGAMSGSAVSGRPVAPNQASWGSVSRMDTEETKRLKENFGFFAPAAFLYAVFYVFCMFQNGSGITYPFFIGGSLLFLCLSLPKLGITLKKGSGFYMTAMLLLGISTFCTDDGRIIFFNKLGIFLLMMSLLLRQCYDTSGWKLGKFLGSICVLIFASIGELGRPFSDAAAYRKNGVNRADKRIWYVVLGLLIGIPLLLVVFLLLASADAVFRQMTRALLENLTIFNIIRVTFRIILVFFGTYALIAYLCRRRIREDVPDRRTGEPVLAITITSLLTLLYLLFSGIQIAGLFFGKLQLPEGYTYAKYAREGFFQLLAVSVLNLIIVLVCMSFFRESSVLKSILTAMSLCTFIMIASSAMRMLIYIRYYYLTFLRILVLWGLALLTVLFIGVIINIFQDRFPLFRYSVAVALSFAHPDYIIAKVNVDNAAHGAVEWRRTSGTNINPYEDFSYLRHLSADAAPVLVPYLRELGYDMNAFYAKNAVIYAKEQGYDDSKSSEEGFGYYWMAYSQERTNHFGLRTFNLSRFMALEAFRR